MTLEDHVGDILGKARRSLKISSEAAAAAAHLSDGEYLALEESGQCAQEVNFEAVGKLLSLSGPRLKAIANGWTPIGVDSGQWREIRQITTTSGMAVNCYLVWDEVSKEAALFDTGWSAEPVFRLIDEHELDLRHLFITHSHSDHIAALSEVRERHPKAKVHSGSKHAPVAQRNRPNDFIHLGSLRISNRETPGHAEDGVTYVIGNFPEDAPSAAIVGDALFAGSMGGAREAFDLARLKIQEQIFSLPDSTLICPGHGPMTTVGIEKQNNPFFP